MVTPCPLSDRRKPADGSVGTRGSKVGREHRTKSPELGFKPPLLLAGSQPPLGLSFLRIELRMLGGGGGGPAAPPVGGSGPCLSLVFFSAKQMSYFFSVFQPVFLPHPSPKCFLALIYLAKKVCGERHRTGHGCHSRCLQLLCVFLRLSPEQLTFSVSLGLDLSGKGREKETHF